MTRFKRWTIELDTYVVYYDPESGSQTFTRMKVRFVSKDWFRFEIYREGLLSKLGKALGPTQDVKVGDPDFDRNFIVKGNDESKLRAFLANFRIRELIEAQPSIQLSVNPSRLLGQRPKGEAQLCFEEEGIITDIERLRSLYELFGESLNQLLAIGSVSEESPATIDFSRSIELDPRDADAYYNRGLAHCDLGDFERAIDDFAEAIHIDPRDADAYYNRGLAFAELGRPNEAIADLEQARFLTRDRDFRDEIKELIGELEGS